MTVCFPPLIKPDGRFSRIRLSEFQVRWAMSVRPESSVDGRGHMCVRVSGSASACISPKGSHACAITIAEADGQ